MADRAATEPSLETDLQSETQAAQTAFDAAYQAVLAHFAAEKETLDRELQETCQAITARSESATTWARSWPGPGWPSWSKIRWSDRRPGVPFRRAAWTLTALLEGIKSSTEKQRKDLEATIAATATSIQALRQEGQRFLEECKLARAVALEAPQPSSRPSKQDPRHAAEIPGHARSVPVQPEKLDHAEVFSRRPHPLGLRPHCGWS